MSAVSSGTVSVGLARDRGKVRRSEARALSSQEAHLLDPGGRYVEGIVQLFYHGDDVVKEDPELQAWCREITEVGLCQAQDRGKTPPQRQELLGPSAQSPFLALPVGGQGGNASPRSRLQAHLLRLRTSRESPPRRPWPSTFHPDRLTCHSTGPNRARTSASEGSARAGDLLARLSSPA